MKLTLVTPEKRVLIEQVVTEVTVPAHLGELNILPGHQPLITTLVPGVIRYRLQAGGEQVAASISWGYCNISPEGVNVLAETVESANEIDYQAAQADLELAEKRMTTETMDDDAWKELQGQLAHTKARLEMEGYTKH
ncbi:MAG: synthase epsilon subunit [Pseudomonadota bacterium]|jgi:F-type H+-transporting ATPase subunit epsilon